MITVRLKGGLGNQMFEYAAGRAAALRSKTELLLDVSYFDFKLPGVTKREFSLDVFNIEGKILKKSFLKFLFHKIFGCGDGYFQSPKYFEGFEDVIRKDFTLKEPLVGKSLALLEEIKNCASVGIHVRRGDYVGNKFHPTLDANYYKRGIEYIGGKSKIDKVYVFSDDTEWCKQNLKFDYQMVFAGEEYAGRYGEGHLALMSACKNFVIANSSFSWWAAWLSENSQKVVVAPKNWFSDEKKEPKGLIPESWVRL